ncbi:MAG: hypothetical protein C6Y22_18090 [Hapalosiphonaceae cyanobacterium JJU2]|nr:MAG: hypothetical protein C6Y22_18090 [Hapalosiphonaceae cyanobacterium JJU2]
MVGKKLTEEERKQQILTATLKVAIEIGLENVTVRRVATAAGLSSGLIFFHFKTKDDLLLALLDELTTWLLTIREIKANNPRSRFIELIRLEAQIENRAFIDLFLEFWILGRHHPVMRDHLRIAMMKYRDIFQLAAQEMLQADETLIGTSSEALAAFASSLVVGNALQVMFDPNEFKTEDLLSVMKAFLPAK